MPNWTRRDLLKTGVAASVGAPALAEAGQAAKDAPAASPRPAPSRERLLLDFGWRFQLGHADDPERDFGFGRGSEFSKSGGMLIPSRLNFDDSQWQAIDLPHDWAVALPFEKSANNTVTDHGSKPLGRLFPATSIGWYRRLFEVPASDLGRRIWLEFDGVYRDAMIVFNGHFIGRHMSGYAPFRYDVTDFVNYGGQNVIVVRVDATQNEGWFYEGAGIYRHVWLVKTHPVHVAHGGTFVTSEVRPGAAVLAIATEVENHGDKNQAGRVVSTVLDPAGKAVASATAAPVAMASWSGHEFKQQLTVAKPALWSLETPHLYRLVTKVEVGGAVVDQYETPFGIRTIRFDADQGFFLNGKPVRILGTCNHQDHAGVGSARPDRIQVYRIRKLKEMGSNAYRTSHNHPTAELLDACDRLGMLVMDETRTMDSCPHALEELEALVRRDRNRPSVFLWSLGNEEREQGSERGARIVATMKRLVRRLDPSRPVTVAQNGGYDGVGVSTVVDVMGFNYNEPAIDGYRQKNPKQPLIGSETASTVSTRGIYANDKDKGYVSAYDLNAPRWASTAEKWWKFYAERPYLAGGFVWTGFDYRGEPTPYGWPCINSHFGLMDVCGFPKDLYYYYRAWWSGKPVLHLFPHWNWTEGREVDVWCHSNLDRVELFLNGQSLGAKDVPRNTHLEWKVPYAPGVLEAVGYKDGKQALVGERQTTGAPAGIVLRPDRSTISADGEDVAMVEVSVVDDQGRIVPTAANEILFEIAGPGRILGVGNGDPSSHEPDKASRRSAFNGLCLAIVQALKQPGEIRFSAQSPGLAPATIAIQCEKARNRGTA
ncbi:MAG: beta-galactosidase GalA [Bryobacteraceae bacterium]|jgi:beta-galactosidase